MTQKKISVTLPFPDHETNLKMPSYMLNLREREISRKATELVIKGKNLSPVDFYYADWVISLMETGIVTYTNQDGEQFLKVFWGDVTPPEDIEKFYTYFEIQNVYFSQEDHTNLLATPFSYEKTRVDTQALPPAIGEIFSKGKVRDVAPGAPGSKGRVMKRTMELRGKSIDIIGQAARQDDLLLCFLVTRSGRADTQIERGGKIIRLTVNPPWTGDELSTLQSAVDEYLTNMDDFTFTDIPPPLYQITRSSQIPVGTITGEYSQAPSAREVLNFNYVHP